MKKNSPYAKLAGPVTIKAPDQKPETIAKHKSLVRRVAKQNVLLRKILNAK
jgi:hypothetical protein